MNLGATVGAVAFTGFCLLAAGMICGDPNDVSDTSMNPFQFIINLLSGDDACSGLPVWFEWVMFILCTVPLLFVLWQFIEPFLNNTVTGTIVGGLVVLAFIGTVLAFIALD